MMKKIMAVAMSVLILSLLLCACTGSNTNGNTPKEDVEQMVTKEWLMETYGITEDDLKGIDLDLIFQSHPWKIAEMDYSDKESLLNGLRIDQEQIVADQENEQWLSENSLSYLLEGTTCQGVLPDVDDLKWIVLESAYISTKGREDNSPTGYNTAVVDVQNGIIYFGFYNNPLSVDYRQADEIYTLSEIEKQSLLNALFTANIMEWSSCDKEKSKWHLGLAFDDGTVCTYEIEDLSGKSIELAQIIFSYSPYDQNYWNYEN